MARSFLTSPISAATTLMTDSTGGVFATRVAPSGSNSPNNPSNLGAIIGGVVGSLTLLLAMFGCLFLRRRTKRMKDTNKTVEKMVEPFNQPPTTTVSASDSNTPSSVGTSNYFLCDKRTGQVGSGQPSSSGSNQNPVSHPQGISDSTLSAQTPVVQMWSNLEASVNVQTEPRLQSPLPWVASNNNPFMQPTRAIHEEDSGIRLPHADRCRIRVEVLPPYYTEG